LSALLVAVAVSLQISGGFAGHTRSARVDRGALKVRDGRKACSRKLAPAQRKKIDAAVRAAKPSLWNRLHVSPGCNDCIVYSVRIGSRRTLWDDTGEADAPADAKAIAALLRPLATCVATE
jgi:hypothetical protein